MYEGRGDCQYVGGDCLTVNDCCEDNVYCIDQECGYYFAVVDNDSAAKRDLCLVFPLIIAFFA